MFPALALLGLGLVLAQGDGVASAPFDDDLRSDCISPIERLAADTALARFGTSSRLSAVPEQLTFFPQAGRLWDDLIPNNFVDLDPSPGILDWDCLGYTYNGHAGADVGLRSFEEQRIGVPVFAALDGIIAMAVDGYFDEWTGLNGCGTPANSVTIDHGNGRTGFYWHLKQGSVAVSAGQFVRAGEQIGLTASSGCSTGPHLHFELQDKNKVIEPFAGPCRVGASEWISQPVPVRSVYVSDLNLSDDTNAPFHPFAMTRRGTFVQGTATVLIRHMLHNLPPNSTWQLRYQRPDGSFDSPAVTVNLQNPNLVRLSSGKWFRTLTLSQLGTWRIRLLVNGQLVALAPFEVVASPAEVVNRPPHPIGASMTPTGFAAEADVLRCSVITGILDDPDYDVVRYRYVWDVEGSVVRNVVSAGRSDVLPRDSALDGDTVTCTVTPSDGSLQAAPARARVQIGARTKWKNVGAQVPRPAQR